MEHGEMEKSQRNFRLTVDGICPCGGKLKTSEWTTITMFKGRTTCEACGRTELKTRDKYPDPNPQLYLLK